MITRLCAAALIVLSLTGTVPAGEPAGTLHVLAIGVNDRHPEGLRYPAKDAADIVRVLREQEGRQYTQVRAVTLCNDEATREKIEQALSDLTRHVRQGDRVVVYLSGHGTTFGGEWHFLPHNFDRTAPAETLVAGRTVLRQLGRLPVMSLLVIDACFAGATFEATCRDRGPGVVILASSMPAEPSVELPSQANGAFTRALVEGLLGKADLNNDGVITLAELDAYVSSRTRQLIEEARRGRPGVMKPAQMPCCIRPAAVPSTLELAKVGARQTPATTGGVQNLFSAGNPPAAASHNVLRLFAR